MNNPWPILNLGSGSNPMPGALNVDAAAGPGVDVVADANRLPFADEAFGEVHAINPHLFQPVCAETARVLQRGCFLFVTGTPRNLLARPVPGDLALAAGLEFVQVTSMIIAHRFGIQRTTSGTALKTHSSKTTIYRRLT